MFIAGNANKRRCLLLQSVVDKENWKNRLMNGGVGARQTDQVAQINDQNKNAYQIRSDCGQHLD